MLYNLSIRRKPAVRIYFFVQQSLGHVCSTFQPQQRIKRRGDETNRRTRAEPQWIVGQAYSHTYSTLSQLSRLQTICLGDSSKFRFTTRHKSIMLLFLRSIF